jgi:hypothetical protein
MGPSIQNRFIASDFVFPGRLHLYNIDTGQDTVITTNQGDSEVLLVDKNVVYYRVSNRLYSASITAGAIAMPKLLATDETIRDVHWAFIKH